MHVRKIVVTIIPSEDQYEVELKIYTEDGEKPENSEVRDAISQSMKYIKKVYKK